jgi:hypothetical protein
MRKFIYSLLLTVLLGIPLSANATIVDDPDVFNFAPFYDPSSGVIGLSLTFFPSEEGDTVYIPDYIYENNQYKYVVNINTGAFYDCHAKYIRLPNHLRFIQDYAFHYCCFLTTLEFTNDISEIDFGEIDDIVGGCNYVDEIIVPLQYLSNYIDDPEDRFFPYFLDEQLKSRINMNSQIRTLCADVNFKVSNNATAFYCTGVNTNDYTVTTANANVIPANVGVCIESTTGSNIDIIATISSSDIVSSKLVPVFSDTYIPAMSNGKYNYYFDENNLKFVKITTSHLIKANNAYLSTIENNNTIEL